MRTALTLIALLAFGGLSGCAADPKDTAPENGGDGPSTSSVLQGTDIIGFGPLYLHASGIDTWMDLQPDGSTNDVIFTAVAGLPSRYTFPLRADRTGPILTNGIASAYLGPASPTTSVTGQLLFTLTLFVDGTAVATSEPSQAQEDIDFAIPLRIEDNSDVVLEVCLCTSLETSGALLINTQGVSTLSFLASSYGPGGNGGPGGSGGSGGEVTVRQEGNQWVAQTTVTVPIESLPANDATVSMTTFNGDVDVIHGDTSELRAELWGRGETEQAARDSLSKVGYDHTVTTEGHLEVEARAYSTTNDGGQRGADLVLRLPTNAPNVSEGTFTTNNGDVRVYDYTFGRLTTDTNNGDIDVQIQADSWVADTNNGEVMGTVATPARSGTYDLTTNNGEIDLDFVRSADHGVDVHGETNNGDVSLSFSGTSAVGEQEDNDKHVRSDDFSSKLIQTTIEAGSNNGEVTLRDT